MRPEYEALAHDFRALAAPFHLAVDESLERDLVLVAASFEAIDRHGDATPDGEDRMLLGAAILRACEQPLATGRLGRTLRAARRRQSRIARSGFASHQRVDDEAMTILRGS